ncbi:MAG: PorV/PorQ family protein [Elusimicrobiales bacterium]
MRLRLLALVLFSAARCAAAGSDAAGTSGAQFLKLGVGARAASLAEAYSAMAYGAEAVYWNPAGMADSDKYTSLSFMHASLFGELSYEFIGAARNFGSFGALGMGLQYLSAGSITETDDAGYTTGTSMAPKDVALSVAYARRFGWCDIGFTGKYIRSTLVESASAMALDIGLRTAPFLNEKMTLAFTEQNLGGKMKFDQEGDPLPQTTRFGAAYAFSDRTTAGADLTMPRDNSMYISAGVETLLPFVGYELAGRFGYTTKNAGDVSGVSGIAFGFGARRGNVGVDYAFAPYGALGAAHRISLELLFGKRRLSLEDKLNKYSDTETDAEAPEPEPAAKPPKPELPKPPSPKPAPKPEKKPEAPKQDAPVIIKPDTDNSATPAVPSYEKKLREY